MQSQPSTSLLFTSSPPVSGQPQLYDTALNEVDGVASRTGSDATSFFSVFSTIDTAENEQKASNTTSALEVEENPPSISTTSHLIPSSSSRNSETLLDESPKSSERAAAAKKSIVAGHPGKKTAFAAHIVGSETRGEHDKGHHHGGKKRFTVYNIIVTSGTKQTYINRRYNDFHHLHTSLLKRLPDVCRRLPRFPPKRLFGNNFATDFVVTRRNKLNSWLASVVDEDPLMSLQCAKLFFDERPDLDGEENRPSLYQRTATHDVSSSMVCRNCGRCEKHHSPRSAERHDVGSSDSDEASKSRRGRDAHASKSRHSLFGANAVLEGMKRAAKKATVHQHRKTKLRKHQHVHRHYPCSHFEPADEPPSSLHPPNFRSLEIPSPFSASSAEYSRASSHCSCDAEICSPDASLDIAHRPIIYSPGASSSLPSTTSPLTRPALAADASKPVSPFSHSLPPPTLSARRRSSTKLDCIEPSLNATATSACASSFKIPTATTPTLRYMLQSKGSLEPYPAQSHISSTNTDRSTVASPLSVRLDTTMGCCCCNHTARHSFVSDGHEEIASIPSPERVVSTSKEEIPIKKKEHSDLSQNDHLTLAHILRSPNDLDGNRLSRDLASEDLRLRKSIKRKKSTGKKTRKLLETHSTRQDSSVGRPGDAPSSSNLISAEKTADANSEVIRRSNSSSHLPPVREDHLPQQQSASTKAEQIADAVVPPSTKRIKRKKSKKVKKREKERRSAAIAQAIPGYVKKVGLSDFKLLRVIGKGSYGKVMLARHKATGEILAIKVIDKRTLRKKPQEIRRVMDERNVLQRSTEHPFLVGLRYSFQTKDKLYLVIDYVNGGELFFHLAREHRFQEPRARFYAAEITVAIEHLHRRNLVYRDLKPENCLLDAQGHVRLVDFGLTKDLGTLSKNGAGTDLEKRKDVEEGKTRTFCGTPEYLAPEILKRQPYGKSVDWYCLGAVLYEMLVGLPPFYSSNPTVMYDRMLNETLKFPSDISPTARSFIGSLLERDPDRRLGDGPTGGADVMNHPFFDGVNWDKVLRREYRTPFDPAVDGELDLRNIDPAFAAEPIPQSLLDDGPASPVTLPTNTSQDPAFPYSYNPFNFQATAALISRNINNYAAANHPNNVNSLGGANKRSSQYSIDDGAFKGFSFTPAMAEEYEIERGELSGPRENESSDDESEGEGTSSSRVISST